MSGHYSSRDRDRRRSRSRSPGTARSSSRHGKDGRRSRSRERERDRHRIERSRSPRNRSHRSRSRDRRHGGSSRSKDRGPGDRGNGTRGARDMSGIEDRRPHTADNRGPRRDQRRSLSRDRSDRGRPSGRPAVAVAAATAAVQDAIRNGSAQPSAREQSVIMEDSLEQGIIVDDVVIDEAAMEDIDKFLEEEEEDEEAQAARLAVERRKRREEIMKKHQHDAVQPPVSDPKPAPVAQSIHTSESNTDFSSNTADMKLVLPPKDNSEGQQEESAFEQSEADLVAEQQAVEEEALKNEPHAFDIFSASPSDQEMGKAGLPKRASSGLLKSSVLGSDGGSHVQSNYDDTEGYYKLTIGEVIDGRYRTQGVVGKGVFSTVLKCVDLVNEETVAVKMIRNNDLMRKAAEKELSVLKMLSDMDPDNKKHCVRLLGHLDYRNHTTFVFESLQMNLRDALKKFGKNVGINVTAVRMYGRQMFVALKYLSDLRIVHADIKLDNILVSDDLKQVKLCDFGSAFLETDPDRDPTPYLVSRFYRAPEIILGLHYDKMVDMWSIGTCLYELFTGHVMFPGRTNNDMLRLMQGIKGRLPNKILKSHLRSYETLGLDTHFDSDFKFKQWDLDPITGKPVLRLVDILKPSKDLSASLLSSKAGADDRNRVVLLADLLHKTIALDPAKRVDPIEAFKHPFFTAKDKAP